MAQLHKVLLIGNYHSHPSCEAFLEKILRVLSHLRVETVLVSGDLPAKFTGTVRWKRTYIAPSWDRRRPFFFALNQLLICTTILRLFAEKRLNTAVFISPAPLPMLLARILGIRVVRYQAGSYSKQTFGSADSVSARILGAIFEKIPSMISHRIIVESSSSIEFQGLNNYSHKITVCSIYVDTDLFHPGDEHQRSYRTIGYIGVVDENKGLRNLLLALIILKDYLRAHDVRVSVVGDGPLLPLLRQMVKESGLSDRVSFYDWIPHDLVAEHLRRLTLLVLPSRSEGLPNIILEAMASGTPVLATPVGAVPDLIHDEITGFLIRCTSPECIAQDLKRALEFQDMKIVAENARLSVEDKYGFDAAVGRWGDILEC